MIIDLTHTIEENMPVFPGSPGVKINKTANIRREGFSELQFSLTTHTGTHIDAPSHIFEKLVSLDKIDLENFIGKAVSLDCSGRKTIGVGLIESLLQKHKTLSYIVFNTGWNKFWGKEEYFHNYPVLDKEAAIMISKSQLKGICLDTISADIYESTSLTNHKILLINNKLIVENLTNTGSLPNDIAFDLYIAPLKISNSDGSPARVFAVSGF